MKAIVTCIGNSRPSLPNLTVTIQVTVDAHYKPSRLLV